MMFNDDHNQASVRVTADTCTGYQPRSLLDAVVREFASRRA